jgi:hypothetical protein
VSRTCVQIHVTCLDIVLDDLPIWADQSHLPLGQRHIDCVVRRFLEQGEAAAPEVECVSESSLIERASI